MKGTLIKFKKLENGRVHYVCQGSVKKGSFQSNIRVNVIANPMNVKEGDEIDLGSRLEILERKYFNNDGSTGFAYWLVL